MVGYAPMLVFIQLRHHAGTNSARSGFTSGALDFPRNNVRPFVLCVEQQKRGAVTRAVYFEDQPQAAALALAMRGARQS